MPTFAISVTVSGLNLDNDQQTDRLHEAAPFALVMSETDRVTTLDAEIDAPSGEEALRIFVAFLRQQDSQITIDRLSEDLVNTTEIAVRLDALRETVRTWVQGSRGPADFPPHRMVLPGGQKLWAWSTVYAWAEVHGRVPVDTPTPIDVACVDWFNANLARPVVPTPEPTQWWNVDASYDASFLTTDIRQQVLKVEEVRLKMMLGSAGPVRYRNYSARNGDTWTYSQVSGPALHMAG